MTLRVKFFLTCAALALVLFCTIYTVRVTTADWQNLQHQTAMVKAKDVHTIRTWMSLAYIARTYQVPENYLITSLHLPNPKDPRLPHETLDSLAFRTKRPVNQLLLQAQSAIISYRNLRTTPPGRGHVFPAPQNNLRTQGYLLAFVVETGPVNVAKVRFLHRAHHHVPRTIVAKREHSQALVVGKGEL